MLFHGRKWGRGPVQKRQTYLLSVAHVNNLPLQVVVGAISDDPGVCLTPTFQGQSLPYMQAS